MSAVVEVVKNQSSVYCTLAGFSLCWFEFESSRAPRSNRRFYSHLEQNRTSDNGLDDQPKVTGPLGRGKGIEILCNIQRFNDQFQTNESGICSCRDCVGARHKAIIHKPCCRCLVSNILGQHSAVGIFLREFDSPGFNQLIGRRNTKDAIHQREESGILEKSWSPTLVSQTSVGNSLVERRRQK